MLLNILLSVIASIALFLALVAVLNGDLAPYFIIVILCGVIIGLLITIRKKLIEIQKK